MLDVLHITQSNSDNEIINLCETSQRGSESWPGGSVTAMYPKNVFYDANGLRKFYHQISDSALYTSHYRIDFHVIEWLNNSIHSFN